MKDLYGSGILLFYFFKWPYLIGFPYLYFQKGLEHNYFLNALWFYCLFLVFKDFYMMYKKYKDKKLQQSTPENFCDNNNKENTQEV
jgi:hypothetical protein